MPDSDTTAKARRIENRMEDCGDGRHVGWWMEHSSLGHDSLLVEVNQHTMLISCCEGEHAEKRINFITSRGKAIEIVRAITKALSMDTENHG